jgi:hypothetical protein
MVKLRLSKLSLNFGFLGADVELDDSARAALHELFADARVRRAVLESPEGRADQPYVTDSIAELRNTARNSLKALGPDQSDVAHAVTQIVDACNQYLSQVSEARAGRYATHPEFEPALRDLRAVIALVAEHVATVYELSIAAQLADAMYEADPSLHVTASDLRKGSSSRTAAERASSRAVSTRSVNHAGSVAI